MAFKTIQGHNVSILHNFCDTTTFRVYVTACIGGLNLKSLSFSENSYD